MVNDKSPAVMSEKSRKCTVTIQIPLEVEAVFREFRTAEFSTLGRDGTPATWPVVMVYQPESGCFLAATSIGLSQKGLNVRRNPRVSLLYSEPKGSGLAAPPAVLVQGKADCPDEITSVEGIEDVWRTVFRRQPASKNISNSRISRYLLDCYYMRLRIIVTPLRILWWPGSNFSKEPQRVEVSHVE